MNFITKKHLSRRVVLRGMGVSLSLPLLESMVPAQTSLVKTAANPNLRFCGIYIPHGAIMSQWTPAKEGAGFEFKPILSPLEPFRDRLLVISGLEAKVANPAQGESGGDHSRSAAAFLSGARAKHTSGVDVHLNATIDQLIAQKIGQDTLLPSIELGIEDVGYTGICGYGYSCAYVDTIAWETPTKPLPMEVNPQVVFERLFGDGANAEQRVTRRQEDRSILDSITHEAARFRKVIGSSDRRRLDDYLEDVREIERRVQIAVKVSAEAPASDVPVGVPQSFDEHAKLMFDLQALAYKADITRVSTFMYARDNSNHTYPASGVNVSFHGASHHGNKPAAIETFAQINKYHMQLFGYFLDKLRSTPDGDGTLLDHSMVLLGSSMSNANEHDHGPLPMLVAGGAAGRLKGGRHIKFAGNPPHSNLLLGVLEKAGIEQDSYGDSTAKFEI
jgi:hypothetical protein